MLKADTTDVRWVDKLVTKWAALWVVSMERSLAATMVDKSAVAMGEHLVELSA